MSSYTHGHKHTPTHLKNTRICSASLVREAGDKDREESDESLRTPLLLGEKNGELATLQNYQDISSTSFTSISPEEGRRHVKTKAWAEGSEVGGSRIPMGSTLER